MNTTTLPLAGGAWDQVSLWFDSWHAAEQAAITRLAPALCQAEDDGWLTRWWFTRKATCWHLRYQPQRSTTRSRIDELLRELAVHDAIDHWAWTIYEPETHAFGGPNGMAVGHALFPVDSRELLDHLRRNGDRHRNERGLLVAGALLRGAERDFYERGDIWARVAAHRTPSRAPSGIEIDHVHRLATAHTASEDASRWIGAFHEAGAALAGLARTGTLTRGLRATLAHHILFAWNRAGIPTPRQALMAQAAAGAVFHRRPAPVLPRFSRSGQHDPTKVSPVNTAHDTTTTQQLRAELVAAIRNRGTFHTPAVENAFARVPRHVFLPQVDPETAYAPQVVVTKHAEDGHALSSASHPNMVAAMLEQLDVRPGHRVLEIGTATGINAALLRELVGEQGQVTSIEIDHDLAEGARAALQAAGYPDVEVISGDGAAGHPDSAPYDRVIVTAGAWDIPAAWWDQLAPTGRMVVPLGLHGSGLTRSIALDRTAPDHMDGVSTLVCGFVPLRGSAHSSGEALALAEDITLNLAPDENQDLHVLGRALTYPAHAEWTGITIDDTEQVEHLDLWLATTTAPHFARLALGAEARRRAEVAPTLRWGGATLHDGAGTLAYLRLRPITETTDELGIIAHGPNSPALTARTEELLRRWRKEGPTQPTITAHPTGASDDGARNGARVTRPDTTVTITW
ncbi:methyltransferase, FxLD system [Nocardiopsis coralliicola]